MAVGKKKPLKMKGPGGKAFILSYRLLTIRRVLLEDAGLYRCTTRDHTSKNASESVQLRVTGTLTRAPNVSSFSFFLFFFSFLLPTFPHLCGRLSFPYQGGVSAKRAWPTRVETFSVRSSFSTQQVALRSTRSFDFLTCPTTFSRVRWGSILFVFFSRSCELPHAST